MIIGNGSIAKMLNDRDGFIFFASGVSDSSIEGTQDDEINCLREKSLLNIHIGLANAVNKCFVYFSTISCNYVISRYTKHKEEMELDIKAQAHNYCIIRIGNIWECRNPNTFINKMQYWQRQNKLLDSMIRDEWKYMISKDQLLFITDNLPASGKHEISIFGTMKKVKDCI